MPQIIVGSLASLLCVALAVRFTAWARGWSTVEPTPGAWLGLVAFVGIHTLLELYRFAGADLQTVIAVWQASLILCGVMFLGILRLLTGLPSWREPMTWALAMAAGAMLTTDSHAYADQRLAELAAAAITFIISLECFWLIPRRDTMGRGVWSVTAVANFFTAFHIFDCQLLRGMIDQPRDTESACSQIYGPWMEWFVVAGCVVAVAVVLQRNDKMGRQ